MGNYQAIERHPYNKALPTKLQRHEDDKQHMFCHEMRPLFSLNFSFEKQNAASLLNHLHNEHN